MPSIMTLSHAYFTSHLFVDCTDVQARPMRLKDLAIEFEFRQVLYLL